MFVTYPDVLQPGHGGLRAGWPLALLAASGAAVSHAIPSEQLACSCHFVSLSHSCLGIACDFGVGCGWGGIVGSGEGRIGGVAMGVAGEGLRVHRGVAMGVAGVSPGVQIWCGCGVDECAWEFLGPRWD